VTRHFSVAEGTEGPVQHMAMDQSSMDHGAMDHSSMDHSSMDHGAMEMDPSCSPTWAEPSPDGRLVWVACNKGDRILEVDRENWSLVRSFDTERGPYNLDVTPDGRVLVATLKQGAGVQFFDLSSGESVATAESTTTVTHGVVVSPDSRYAFVSVEGVGAEPGKVDVYDLQSFEMVGSVEVGQQAGGITFWSMEAPN
jgi:DNA-binding beta-propeller fold protein YncE